MKGATRLGHWLSRNHLHWLHMIAHALWCVPINATFGKRRGSTSVSTTGGGTGGGNGVGNVYQVEDGAGTILTSFSDSLALSEARTYATTFALNYKETLYVKLNGQIVFTAPYIPSGGGGGGPTIPPYPPSPNPQPINLGNPPLPGQPIGTYITATGATAVVDTNAVAAINAVAAAAPKGALVVTPTGQVALNAGSSTEVGVGVYQANLPMWLPSGNAYATFAALGFTTAKQILVYIQSELDHYKGSNPDVIDAYQSDIDFLRGFAGT